jgi:hypothetical protein
MTTLTVPTAVLGQLSYHVGCAARLAAAQRQDESIPHAVLAWGVLESLGGEHLDRIRSSFDLPDDVGDLDSPQAAPVRQRAEELALQLCAHFTSEGQHQLARLYQDVYDRLATAA